MGVLVLAVLGSSQGETKSHNEIGWAIEGHLEGISAEDLAEVTGLHPGQIERGVLWQDLGALR